MGVEIYSTKSFNKRKITCFHFFDEIMDEMFSSGKISSYKAYKGTKLSIIKFKGNKVKLSEINLSFLQKYEVFLRGIGNNNGGISFKMRYLKALINKAIK